MAKSSKIRVMISSRCNDLFPLSVRGARLLSEIRKRLKSEIEAFQLFGQKIYEVWINEDAIEVEAVHPGNVVSNKRVTAMCSSPFITAMLGGWGQVVAEHWEFVTLNSWQHTTQPLGRCLLSISMSRWLRVHPMDRQTNCFRNISIAWDALTPET